jgi:hypothetical protein
MTSDGVPRLTADVQIQRETAWTPVATRALIRCLHCTKRRVRPPPSGRREEGCGKKIRVGKEERRRAGGLGRLTNPTGAAVLIIS